MEAFRDVTRESGLTLHAPAARCFDPVALQAEFAALDSALPPEGRTHYGAAPGTGWTAIPLQCEPARSLLERLPTLRSAVEWPGPRLTRVFILRQPAGGILDWHVDHIGIHRQEARLLIPIHAPTGAITLIGHDSAAYPEGQCWTGDFCFPHRVENFTDRDRIVLALDVTVDGWVKALFPPELGADVPLRGELASRSHHLHALAREAASA